jgi:hypothetical protein
LTSFFLVTVFVGDILAGLLAKIYPTMAPSTYFSMLTAMMLAVSAAFYFVAKNFDERRKPAVA